MIAFPSILEKTGDGLRSQVLKLTKFFSHFQIDIADGIFTPSKTVQLDEIMNNSLLPADNFITYEFHLMVKDYEKNIKKLIVLKKTLNIDIILVHASLSPPYPILKTLYPSFSFGLVLNPEDEVNTIASKYDLNKIPFIQIMSVVPGAQGNPFLPETLIKIEQLRTAGYRNKISLDGAVNETTIPLILSKKYLPDIVCPGSYLTKTDKLPEHISYLKTL